MSPNPAADPTGPPFRHVHTDAFAHVLDQLSASLLVSTYQAGKLVVIRTAQGRVSTLLRSFEQPMGLAVEPHRIAVGTRNQVWTLRNAPELAPQLNPHGQHDA